MEEIVALVLTAFGEICCQVLAAGGADLIAAFAAYMSQNEKSTLQRGWKFFFWGMLPLAIILSGGVLIAILNR